MTTPRDLNRIQARLTALGHQPLLEKLLAGPLMEKLELSFPQLKQAKEFQRLFYSWLWFYPSIKAGLKLQLNEAIGVALIIPCSISEKRGRKGAKR